MAYVDKKLLQDTADRAEFQLSAVAHEAKEYYYHHESPEKALASVELTPTQRMTTRYIARSTPQPRLLLNHDTGAGKSLNMLNMAQDFINRAPSGSKPRVFVISFTGDILMAEIFRYPQLGILEREDYEMMAKIRAQARAMGATSLAHAASYIGTLKRKIRDPARGGHYTFYGYEEFANQVFMITIKGKQTEFSVQSLFGDSKHFEEKLTLAIKSGLVRINEELVESIADQMVFCDEIHDVYNIRKLNIYGVAIEYVLNILGERAPKVVYMSATPLTGSAVEIVSLINLLVPRADLPDERPIAREDLFRDQKGHSGASELLSGALDTIRDLLRGRVSFLTNPIGKDFPRRILVGEEISDVKYLRVTIIPVSAYHQATINAALDAKTGADAPHRLTQGQLGLYDIAFPNPTDAKVGLYDAASIIRDIDAAPEAWKRENGVHIKRNKRKGYIFPYNLPITSGSWLERRNLAKYSAKYAQMLDTLLDAIRAGEPKIMIYHNMVQTYGVALIYEILLMNGFAEAGATPVDTTICSQCAVAMAKHKSTTDHEFSAAYITVIHSLMDDRLRAAMTNIFNDPRNVTGRLIKVLIGSRKVHQSISFFGVTCMINLSVPQDISFLVQLYGRCIRRGSHKYLPEDKQYVKIHTFISGMKQNLDIDRLRRKMNEYLVIQSIYRVIRADAVDAFMNYLPERSRPDIDTIDYVPTVSGPKERKTSTAYAYGYFRDDVEQIIAYIATLFDNQALWSLEDLKKALFAAFGAKNEAIAPALAQIQRSMRNIVYVQIGAKDQKYILRAVLNQFGAPVVEFEQFLWPRSREDDHFARVHDVTSKIGHRQAETKAKHIETFSSARDAMMAPKSAQLAWLRAVAAQKTTLGPTDAYHALGILRRAADLTAIAGIEAYSLAKNGFVAYNDAGIINIHADEKWFKLDAADAKPVENDVIIGIIEDERLKLRYPVAVLSKMMEKVTDLRKLQRGAVCSSWDRAVMDKICAKLGIKADSTLGSREVCEKLANELFKREFEQRGRVKWLYLPFDAVQDIRFLTSAAK